MVLVMNYDARFESGGYNLRVAKLPAYYDAFGTLFSLIGYFGLWDSIPSHLQIFNYYLFGHLFVQLVVFTLDMITLTSLCEGWAGNIQSQITPNRTLYGPSIKGLCQVARVSYLIGFMFDFGLHAYFTYVSVDYTRNMAMNPGILISFDGKSSPGSESVPVLNPNHGEPVNYMGPGIKRPTEQHGFRYGALPEETEDD